MHVRTPTRPRNSIRRCALGLPTLVARRFGVRRTRRPFSEFIPLKETLRAARAAGLSVSDYIERRHPTGPRSALDQTMDGIDALGLFKGPIESVCEIGPVTGRYLEKFTARLRPRHYEIYETSQEWREWLVKRYSVTAHTCDGRTLAETASGSMDLVHSHKVFSGLPFLTTVSYLREMARTVRAGGWVVFDIMTERCFSRERLDAWFRADPWQWEWSPHLTAQDYVVDMLAERGLLLVGSFEVPLFPAVTECLVFHESATRIAKPSTQAAVAPSEVTAIRAQRK